MFLSHESVCVCVYVCVLGYESEYAHTHTHTHTQSVTVVFTLFCVLHRAQKGEIWNKEHAVRNISILKSWPIQRMRSAFFFNFYLFLEMLIRVSLCVFLLMVLLSVNSLELWDGGHRLRARQCSGAPCSVVPCQTALEYLNRASNYQIRFCFHRSLINETFVVTPKLGEVRGSRWPGDGPSALPIQRSQNAASRLRKWAGRQSCRNHTFGFFTFPATVPTSVSLRRKRIQPRFPYLKSLPSEPPASRDMWKLYCYKLYVCVCVCVVILFSCVTIEISSPSYPYRDCRDQRMSRLCTYDLAVS